MSLECFRRFALLSLIFFLSPSMALSSDSEVSVEARVTDAASSFGLGLKVDAPGSGLGLAVTAGLGSSYGGQVHFNTSGEIRYAFDVFTYVPWIGAGFGLRLDDRMVVYPQATFGLSVMQGFDDAFGISYTNPLVYRHFSQTLPFEIGLYWSRRL